MPIYRRTYRVWWNETDAAGIVHFTNFLRYCERAEEELLQSIGFQHEEEKLKTPRIVLPRVKAACEYLYPLWPADKYTVSIDHIIIGCKSITYSFTITNDTKNKISAKCTITAVAYNTEKGTTIPIPHEIIEKLVAKGAKLRDNPNSKCNRRENTTTSAQ